MTATKLKRARLERDAYLNADELLELETAFYEGTETERFSKAVNALMEALRCDPHFGDCRNEAARRVHVTMIERPKEEPHVHVEVIERPQEPAHVDVKVIER
jgi:hypothetical protein